VGIDNYFVKIAGTWRNTLDPEAHRTDFWVDRHEAVSDQRYFFGASDEAMEFFRQSPQSVTALSPALVEMKIRQDEGSGKNEPLRGIWIEWAEAREIIEREVEKDRSHCWEWDPETAVTTLLFSAGEKLYQLPFFNSAGNYSFESDSNDAIEHDSDSEEVFCVEMEAYQVPGPTVTKYRVKTS
jgi:hypothetical protein